MKERTLEGALTFLGFVISVMAVFYFAVEFLWDVSHWTRLAALVLLGLCFAFLGVWIRGHDIGRPFFEGDRLRWLRPAVVLYLLAIIAGITAEGVFLGIDDLPQALRVLLSLLIGIGLIVFVARRAHKKEKAPVRS